MKKITLSLLLSFGLFAFVANAQLSGTYTIDTASATAGTNYDSYAAFVTDITTNGVIGPVTVNVMSDASEQVVITAITGVNATNTVTINGNGNSLSFAPLSTDKRIIGLDGADYITIDSLNIIGTGTTYGWGVHLKNGSDNNTISNCTIDLSGITSTSSSNSAGIVMSGSNTSQSTDGVTGSDNTFDNNTIMGGASGGPYYGVYINGNGSGSNGMNNDVTNNTFLDLYAYAIYMDDQESSLISGNDYSRPNRTSVTTAYMVFFTSGSSQDNLIEKNAAHNLFDGDPTPTSSAFLFYNSSNDAGAGLPNRYVNNIVYELNNTGSIYAFYNSGSDNVQYYHNTVSLDDTAATGGTTRGFYQTTTATGVDFRNNIISITRGGSGTKHGIYLNTATSTVTCDYNNLYVNSAGSGAQHYGRYNAIDETTFSNWQAANSGAYDQNSSDNNPAFTSLSNLIPTGFGADESGFNLGIATDYTGAARDTTPDMGAYEYTGPVITCFPPTALSTTNVTATAADLDWTENNSAANWEIEYGASGFTQGSGTTVIVATKPHALSGLTSATGYDWYVRSICGVGDTSMWSGSNSFTTLIQGPVGVTCVTGNPGTVYTEEFDAQGGWTGNIGTGNRVWRFHSNGTGSGGTGPSGAHSGNGYVYFESSSGTPTTASLVSPSIDLSAGLNTAELSFWYHAYGNPVGTIDVGVGTSAAGPFTNVFSYSGAIQSANADPWTNVGVNLDAYVGQTIYLEFLYTMNGTGFAQDVAIDLVEISTCTSCSQPSALSASNLTLTSADLNWTENGTATNWEVEWGASGFTQGSGTTVIDTAKPFNITGLTAGTAYDFYVRSICAPGDTSGWSGPQTFSTLIGTPYSQNFDLFPNGNISTDGWSNSRNASVPDWTAGSSTGSSGTGPNQDHTTGSGKFLYTETSGASAGVVDTLSSPAILLGAADSAMEFAYWYHMHGAAMGDLQVWISHNGTWDSLATYSAQQQANQGDPWLKATHQINGYQGQSIVMYFLGIAGTSYTSDMAVDDVSLMTAPTCLDPTSPTVANVTTTSADLGWTDPNSATSFEIEWGATGFTQGSGTVVATSSNPHTLSGLMSSTDYDWYVRTICGAGDTSLWVSGGTFKTAFQCPTGAVCATGGEVQTDRNFTSLPGTSACPGIVQVVVPTGDQIDSVTAIYDMTAQAGAWISEQRSAFNSPSTGVMESSMTNGSSINAGGTDSYNRAGLTFANGAQDTVTIELHAGRTFGGSGCDASQNRVDSGWVVIAYHSAAPMCAVPNQLMTTNVSSDTADISWNDPNNPAAPSYEVSYDTAGFTAGSGNQMIVTTSSATLTGLSPTTDYDWYVRAICAPTDTSAWSLVGSFTTPIQGPIGVTCITGNATVAYSDELDAQGGWTGDIGTGSRVWRFNSGGTGSGGTGPSAAHSGTGYAYFEASSGTPTTASLVSPSIDLTSGLNTAELSFWMHAFGANMGTLDVGVGTSATGPFTNVFSWTGQIQTANADPWTNVGVNLDAYVGQTIYLEFFFTMNGTGFTQDMAVDLVEISTCANCAIPTALSTTNIAATSADLGWTDPNGATQWEIEWGPSGFSQGSGTSAVVTSNPHSLTGLTTITAYDWYVRAICAPGDTSGWSPAASFTTTFACPTGAICATYTAGNIESDITFQALPGSSTCPGVVQVVIPTGNRIDSISTFYDFTATVSANAWMSEQRSYLYSPTSGMGESSLAQGTGNTPGTFSYNRTGLTFASGETDTVVVEMHAGRTFGGVVCDPNINFIDSASWTTIFYYSAIPTCLEPDSLNGNGFSTIEAEITWNDVNNPAAPSYEVSYGSPGFAAGTGTQFMSTGSPDTISGLSAGTNYEFYVRAICAPGDTSPWSVNPGAFFTQYGVPFNEDFETFPGGLVGTNGWFSRNIGNPVWLAGTSTPSTATGPAADHTIGGGGTFIFLETSAPAAQGDRDTLTTPDINVLPTQTSLTLSYWYHKFGVDQEDLIVYAEANGVWDSLTTIAGQTHLAQGDPWLVNSHVLTTYAGQTMRLHFVGERGLSFNGDMAIDDVQIIETPSCLAPTNLSDTLSALTSVQLDWTENNMAMDWDIEYGPVGFTPGTGTTVNTTAKPYVLSGLTPSTTYDYYVISNCGPANISPRSFKASFSTLNGVPYFEDFTGFGGPVTQDGWFSTTPGNPQWLGGTNTPSAGTGPTADHTTGAGGSFVFLETSAPSTTGSTDTLVSAEVEVGASQTAIELSYWYHMFGATMGSLEVWVIDSAGTADSITTISGQQQLNQGDPWLEDVHILTGYQGRKIRVVFVGIAGTSFTSDMAIDDVSLDLPPAADIGITDIIAPASGCGLGNDSVIVEITNYGGAAQTNFDVGYALNGVAITPETVSATLGVGQSIIYTFTTTANVGTAGAYDIDAYSLLAGDANAANDTDDVTINSFASVSTFPYSESFETGAGDWVETGNASWELGAPAGGIIDTASDGTEAWVTDLTANYGDNETGAVVSPCFDFTNIPNPYIQLDIWWNIETSWDGAIMQTSIDNGLTWQKVGAFGDPNNWYTDNTIDAIGDNGVDPSEEGWTGVPGSGGWVLAENWLGSVGGQSSVQIRIAFASDGNTNNEGFAFDNVHVFDSMPPDPYYPIGIINTEDSLGVADSLNVACFTSGTVVGVDLDGNAGLSFYIIDQSTGSQEGINVFNFNDVSGYVVNEGDSILAHGTIIQFNGLTELNVDSISIISTGATIPAARNVTTLDESTEAEHIRISNLVVITPSGSGTGSYNMTASNGTDTLTIRVDSDTDVHDSLMVAPLLTGDTICSMEGIGGQFDTSTPLTGGYQFFPMFWSDVDTLSCQIVGIDDIEAESSIFSIVPNPTNGQFVIQSNGFDNAQVRVMVRDINGRIISDEFISNANSSFTKSFDLSENAEGMYFISIQDGDNIINKKLILH